MFLIEILIVLCIMGLLAMGRMPTLGEIAIFAVVIGVGGFLLMLVRNRFADGVVSMFTGGGSLPSSAAELMTDQADGFVQQQEYDAALYEYEQALRRAKGRQRPKLMLRLAETALLADHPDEAMRWWRQALNHKKGLSEDERAGAMFRMAEVLQERKGDGRGAARLLAQVREMYPASKFAGYAEDRLRQIVAGRART